MRGMSLSGIRYIYAARLQARAVLVQEVFAILGIAVGVALLFASQVSSTSLARSVAQLNSQLVGDAQLQLEARGPEGFSEGLLEEVRRVPGVQIAIPAFQQQVNAIGRTGERSVDLIGIDSRTIHASGPLLRRFSARALANLPVIALPGPLATEIGEGPLQAIKLQIGARFVTTLVGATLSADDIGGLIHSPVAVAPIRYAQRLIGADRRLSLIFVRYNPADATKVHVALARLAAAADVNLAPGTIDARLFAVAVAPESKSEKLFSGISALVGFMFALNAMLITVPSRRKLIKDIRPHGATRWMTLQILLFDALVIGVLACVLGLAVGNVLSIAVFNTTPGYLASAFPVGNIRIVTWQSVALAVAAGMTAAILGVLWPVREIASRPLQPAPRSEDTRRRATAIQIAAGLLCLCVTTATLIADPNAALAGNIALVLALVCLLPPLFDVIVGAFGHTSIVLNSVPSALAVTELQTPRTRVRSLAIAATAAVAVFGVVEFQGTQSNLTRGLDASARGTDSSANIWITPRGKTSIQPTTPFTAVNASALLASLPGVSHVGIFHGSFLNWGDRRLWVLAPSASAMRPVPASQVVSGDPNLASERVRRGGWIVLSQALAAEHSLHVGETFVLPSPRPLTVRIAALTTNLGWPPGAIVLSASSYARGWASDDPSAYQIQTTAGAPIQDVRELVRTALKSEAGLVVETSTEREHRHYAVAAQGLSRLTQIRLLVLISAILAVTAAMAAMIWQRRELIAALKSHGYRERVLWRWLLCEAAVLLFAGCSAGAIFGLYAQLLGSHFLATVTGFPIVFDIEGLAAVITFSIVSSVALAAAALPGYLVVRARPKIGHPAH